MKRSQHPYCPTDKYYLAFRRCTPPTPQKLAGRVGMVALQSITAGQVVGVVTREEIDAHLGMQPHQLQLLDRFDELGMSSQQIVETPKRRRGRPRKTESTLLVSEVGTLPDEDFSALLG